MQYLSNITILVEHHQIGFDIQVINCNSGFEADVFLFKWTKELYQDATHGQWATSGSSLLSSILYLIDYILG